MDIREQIAALIRTSYRTDSWHLERASDILALPELPENLKRLKLYPKLVEALVQSLSLIEDLRIIANKPVTKSARQDQIVKVLAEAKKLEDK